MNNSTKNMNIIEAGQLSASSRKSCNPNIKLDYKQIPPFDRNIMKKMIAKDIIN